MSLFSFHWDGNFPHYSFSFYLQVQTGGMKTLRTWLDTSPYLWLSFVWSTSLQWYARWVVVKVDNMIVNRLNGFRSFRTSVFKLFLCDFLQATFVFSLVKYTPLKFNNTIEIGRASCRERVWMAGVGGSLKKVGVGVTFSDGGSLSPLHSLFLSFCCTM